MHLPIRTNFWRPTPCSACWTTEVEEAAAEGAPEPLWKHLPPLSRRNRTLAEQIGKKGSRSHSHLHFAGLRAEELRLVDVGDIRTLDDGPRVINVKGKGGRNATSPSRQPLLR